MILQVISVTYLSGYKLLVKFNNSLEGIVDLEDSLNGFMFEPLKDIKVFQQFKLEDELGTLSWENGADFAPEYLYFLAFKEVQELRQQFEKWNYLNQ